MIMAAVYELIPQAAEGGCDPAPKVITEEAVAFLEKEGLSMMPDQESPARRYATLTNFPVKGGCEVCRLLAECPKGQGGKDDNMSIELPGYERNVIQ